MEADNLSLSWLHCNECQRSFEHHTRLSVGPSLSGGLPGDLQVMRCDLVFSFTSCGHFFCKTCRLQHTISDRFICSICESEAHTFEIENNVPKVLEMYLKPPIGLVEDAISVMNFQISNSSRLIKSLRAKVLQQKEILTKAKQELTAHKLLKEKLTEVQMENLQLHKRLEQVTRAAGAVSSVDYREKSNLRPPSSPSSDRMSALKRRDRMSLQSPIVAKYNLLDTRMDHAGWHGAPPNSPLITSRAIKLNKNNTIHRLPKPSNPEYVNPSDNGLKNRWSICDRGASYPQIHGDGVEATSEINFDGYDQRLNPIPLHYPMARAAQTSSKYMTPVNQYATPGRHSPNQKYFKSASQRSRGGT